MYHQINNCFRNKICLFETLDLRRKSEETPATLLNTLHVFHLRSSQCSLNLSWWWKKTNSYDLCMLKHSCWISSTSACDNTWPVLSEIPTTASAAIRGGSIEAITAAATAAIGFGCAGFFRHWPPRRCSALITRPCQSKWKASSPSTPPLRSAPLQLFLFTAGKRGKGL